MKKLFFALIAAAVISMVSQADAQTYGEATIMSGGTNNVATTATNSYTTGKEIVLDKRTDVGLLLSYKGNAADTGNVTFVFQRAIEKDSANFTWSTTTQRIVVPANGVTTVAYVTNITVGAVGRMRLSSIENACTNAITNIVVKYSLKP